MTIQKELNCENEINCLSIAYNVGSHILVVNWQDKPVGTHERFLMEGARVVKYALADGNGKTMHHKKGAVVLWMILLTYHATDNMSQTDLHLIMVVEGVGYSGRF